jgi:hypothetical protein
MRRAVLAALTLGARVAAALAIVACGSSGPGAGTGGAVPDGDAGATCGALDALVAVSDYASSGVGAFALGGAGKLAFGVDLGADPVLATSGGRAFFLARDQDVVFELDPRCGTPIRKTSVHDPDHRGTTNPQDVAVAPDGALWVPRYNAPSIAIVDATGVQGTIDLRAYDDDQNPNASAIAIALVGGVAKAFVTLERLDDTVVPPAPRLPSRMLRIDVASRVIEAATDLEGRNPFGLVSDGGVLYLAEPGDFASADDDLAGVERFDPATSTSRLLARERDLGGSVAEVAISGGCGAAVVADATAKNVTSLVTFDVATGAALTRAPLAVLGPTDGFDLQGLAWKGDVLMVGDRRRVDRGYAVHAFDRTGACDLHMRPDAVFLQQKPVALRAVP